MTLKERPPSEEFSEEANNYRPKKKFRLPIGSSAPLSRGGENHKILENELSYKNQSGDPLTQQTELPHTAKTNLAAPYPLSPIENTPISKQLVCNREAISELLVSDNGAIGKRLDSNKDAISMQLVCNREAISELLVSEKEANKGVIGEQLDSDKGVNRGAIGKQLVCNPISFQHLSPLQQQFLSFLFEETKKTRSRITDPVSSSTLAEALSTTKNTLKDLVAKLKKRNAFTSAYSKRGACGWTIFELSDSIYHELLDAEKAGKLNSIGKQLVGNKGVNREATSSSSNSSSVLDSNKLTNTETENNSDKINLPKNDLPVEWQEIDFTDLIKNEVHFGRSHLKQWHDRKYCTAKEAQESIWHFGYFMANAPKDKRPGQPINYFMGIMSKSHYFSRPDGYISPEELAIKQRTEDMKRKSENMKRLQEDHFGAIFEAWFDSLTGYEINALTPMFKGLDAKKATLKEQFRDEFYLTIRDNPGIDITTLKLKAPSQQEIQTSKEAELLQSRIKEYQDMLKRHPLDGDTQAKLHRCEAELRGLKVTVEEARRIADSQFGKLQN